MKKKIDEIFGVLSIYFTEKKIVELSPSLSGNIGILLFLKYYYILSKEMKVLRELNNLVLKVIEQANQCIDSPYYLKNHWNGLSGLLWALHRFNQKGGLDQIIDLETAHYHNLLTKIMIVFLKSNEYDFISGGLGIANTLNMINQKDEKLSKLIAAELLSSSIINEEKKAYWVVINKHTGKLQINLGLAHGMPSIIKVLSDIAKNGNANSMHLLEKAISYLLDQKLPSNQYNSIYPNFAIESMDKLHSSRLAWCYGDLGISVALWHASQALGRKDWEQEAIETLLHASKRRGLVENGVVDAGLCHGTAGIAHIFNRMYGYTGLEELKEASNYWFAETLKMARFEDGLAGFKAWQGNERGWVNEPGLLEGIAGIGLALISAVSDIEPAWDECLLLS